MRKTWWILALGAAIVLAWGACGDDDGNTPVEDCTNNLDDDGDGRTDCADSNCASNPACTSACGNGTCDTGETPTSCPADCHTATCGNGTCDAGETATSCPADCSTATCGNGTCDAGETATSCPADCATATGELSCGMMTQCAVCCASSDAACGNACTAAGTEEAQGQMAAFLECGNTECGTECSGTDTAACRTCMSTNCAAETTACGFAPGGTAGCRATITCLQACPAAPASGSGTGDACATHEAIGCYNDCFVASDQNAIDLFMAYQTCLSTSCATECGSGGSTSACQTCATTNCATPVSACAGD